MTVFFTPILLFSDGDSCLESIGTRVRTRKDFSDNPEGMEAMKKTRNPADYVIGDDVEVTGVNLDQEAVYVNGERLTDKRVEQMAQESVRLTREREANLVPGSKSLSGGTTHSPAVQVVVSEATHAELKQLAHNRGMSVSKLLRPVLEEFIRRETHMGNL
jgi:hypothetical protein